jgi:hypothetical protein
MAGSTMLARAARGATGRSGARAVLPPGAGARPAAVVGQPLGGAGRAQVLKQRDGHPPGRAQRLPGLRCRERLRQSGKDAGGQYGGVGAEHDLVADPQQKPGALRRGDRPGAEAELTEPAGRPGPGGPPEQSATLIMPSLTTSGGSATAGQSRRRHIKDGDAHDGRMTAGPGGSGVAQQHAVAHVQRQRFVQGEPGDRAAEHAQPGHRPGRADVQR